MPRKTKIIFISVFIFVGAILLGLYFYNKNKPTTTTSPIYNLYQKFNPFTPKQPTPSGDGTGDGVVENKPQNIINGAKLTKLTDFAISGAVYFDEKKLAPVQPTAAEVTLVTTNTKNKVKVAPVKIEPVYDITPSLRYVERATGHIYQRNLNTGAIGKISNSTIPSVYETIFDGSGSSVVYRYVSSGEKSITSFLATLGAESDFLSPDILELSVSPQKDKFFSIIKNKNGVIGNIRSFKDKKTTPVFTSAFSEWLPQWVTEQNIFLTTKSSYLVNGSVYSLNTISGTLTKVLGGIPGLTTLANKDGSLLLYGASLDVGPKLNIFDIKSHKSIDLGVYGLPEKCVWANDNINVYCAVPSTIAGTQYPDSWYQGTTSFNDYFIKIDTSTKTVSTITNIGESESIDAINLFLSIKEDKLFFTNKKDYTLWQLGL